MGTPTVILGLFIIVRIEQSARIQRDLTSAFAWKDLKATTEGGPATMLMNALQMTLAILMPHVPTQKAPFTVNANLDLMAMVSITAPI